MRKLDSDLLRTFLAVIEAGTITGGAQLIHRSQSAVSLQVSQLEGLLGKPVFARHARGVELTDTGETLLPTARRVIQTLDRTQAEITGEGLIGRLRIGIQEEHAAINLPQIIGRFVRNHPAAELIVRSSNGSEFRTALTTGALDMAIHEVEEVKDDMTLLRQVSIGWVASRSHPISQSGPLPVALFDRACWWRAAAIRSLDACDRDYRVVLTSESTGGITAAIEAGIAIGVLDCSTLVGNLVPLASVPGLQPLPKSHLVLEIPATSKSPLAEAMTLAITESYREHR